MPGSRSRPAAPSASQLREFGLTGQLAVIDYADNGPGIQDERKETIFEPFVSFRRVLASACPSYARSSRRMEENQGCAENMARGHDSSFACLGWRKGDLS